MRLIKLLDIQSVAIISDVLVALWLIKVDAIER